MVRNDRRTRLLPKIILGQFVVGLIVICISLGVIFYAEGYRLNFSTFKIVKTGVVYLDFQPNDVTVTWNNLSKKESSNFVKNLTPGFYNFSISKPGFTPWQLQLQVQSQSVNDYNEIILFRSDIVTSNLSDTNKIAFLNAPTDVLASNAPDQLLSNAHEIWIGSQLVTRFAEPLQRAIWYPDLSHIVFQQGKEIRVIESSGQNDTLLATLSSEESTVFNIGNRGTELYFKDGDQYKVATIR
ncbi:MAG TPA: hypothetical protein VJK08_02795 [Patescibacteria group bacterium]|nr:hypothetical protein [Patescibacteria group bacterium]